MISQTDVQHLRRCIELAAHAVDGGNEPFGSILVAADGTVRAEQHNRVGGGDPTRHPELELARWAAANMTQSERSRSDVAFHCAIRRSRRSTTLPMVGNRNEHDTCE
jgi:tRNA(Arg) A34 adenosine deaminase TadA